MTYIKMLHDKTICDDSFALQDLKKDGIYSIADTAARWLISTDWAINPSDAEIWAYVDAEQKRKEADKVVSILKDNGVDAIILGAAAQYEQKSVGAL